MKYGKSPTTPASFKRGRMVRVLWDPKELIGIPNGDGTFREVPKGNFADQKVRLDKSSRRKLKAEIRKIRKEKNGSIAEVSEDSRPSDLQD